MQKRKKLRLLLPVLTALVLTLLSAACVTPIPEYSCGIPAVVFPVFPAPECVSFDEESSLVSLPLWYWEEIAKYKISVDAIEIYLYRLKHTEE